MYTKEELERKYRSDVNKIIGAIFFVVVGAGVLIYLNIKLNPNKLAPITITTPEIKESQPLSKSIVPPMTPEVKPIQATLPNEIKSVENPTPPAKAPDQVASVIKKTSSKPKTKLSASDILDGQLPAPDSNSSPKAKPQLPVSINPSSNNGAYNYVIQFIPVKTPEEINNLQKQYTTSTDHVFIEQSETKSHGLAYRLVLKYNNETQAKERYNQLDKATNSQVLYSDNSSSPSK